LVELHCHGGRAVVDAVLGALAAIAGLRVAHPGEFTRRAFDNERIDLTEDEGLADLIEAETESQRRSALLMAEGGLSRQIEAWRQRLLELSARAEVAIDYVEDDAVDGDPQLARDLDALARELGAWLSRPRAEPLKDGLRLVIAGPPNAGKSSLLNAIVGQERAIVTAVAGTTRDHIDVPLALSGVPVRLTDTAGLRESLDDAERIGVDRARSLIDVADVLLWLGEPDEAPEHPRLLRIHARCDLPERRSAPTGSIAVSAKNGTGVSDVVAAIVEATVGLLPAGNQLALNRRQAECLAEARDSLVEAKATEDPVLVAESLRSTRAAFDRLTGRAGVEDFLDALFGRFCLGK
jgi:tRNA modification GTPase